ncbi:hypothetical protein PI87_10265 [Ralstonia sp. A12]|nr:hypothetical protein PI87_10265 [Ralstonia sp. A12]
MTVVLGQLSAPDAKGVLVPQLLENQLTAAERYNQPSFRVEVLNTLGLPSPNSGNRDAQLIFDSLKAMAGRAPNVINVQVSAYSRESAGAALDAALKTFSSKHRKLFDQATDNLKNSLSTAQSNLAEAQQDHTQTKGILKSLTTAQASTIGNSARDLLVSNTATMLNGQILDLQQQVAVYQDALSPMRSYPTEAMGPAYVPESPSTPGAPILGAAGALLGLLVGAGLVLRKVTATA